MVLMEANCCVSASPNRPWFAMSVPGNFYKWKGGKAISLGTVSTNVRPCVPENPACRKIGPVL
jgi:hypothetical protein